MFFFYFCSLIRRFVGFFVSNHPNSSLGFSRFLLLIYIFLIFTRLALKHFFNWNIFFTSSSWLYITYFYTTIRFILLWLILSCFHRLRNLLVLKFELYLEAMFLFKSLPQGLFRSEDANSNKIISRCHHAAGLGPQCPMSSRSPKTKQSKNNGDHEQVSNSERTEVRWRFSELLSDGSFKTSEIRNTNLTILNGHPCRWTQIRWIC